MILFRGYRGPAGMENPVDRDDPRVTRVGHFPRRASTDQPKQLFDVVFHRDLSLIGPRPRAILVWPATSN